MSSSDSGSLVERDALTDLLHSAGVVYSEDIAGYVLSSPWLTEHDAAKDAEIAVLRSERSDYQQKWHQANRRIAELATEHDRQRDAATLNAAADALFHAGHDYEDDAIRWLRERARAVQGGEPAPRNQGSAPAGYEEHAHTHVRDERGYCTTRAAGPVDEEALRRLSRLNELFGQGGEGE